MRSLKAALEHGFDVIALDAGSSTPGPIIWGRGKVWHRGRWWSKRDLKTDHRGRTNGKAHVPILIGTACGSGATPRLGLGHADTDEIVEELISTLR